MSIPKDTTKGSPPDPEEIKTMLEGVFNKIGSINQQVNFESMESGEKEEDLVEQTELDDILNFSYLPRDIKAHLDRFVIKQDEAKKALSIAVCDHYNNARFCDEAENGLEFHKQNVLVTGPTGVGKTYLVKHVADLIGVPFIKADATKFSETGYVGRDVEDLVRDLVKKADGDVELAEYGIIYIDEVDKLASGGGKGRDVSGRGVQTTLLKLMEETEVSLINPMDMQGQMMNMMRGKSGKAQKETVNTRHILFIVSGAFSGLDKIIAERTRDGTIGFAARQSSLKIDTLNSFAETADFIKYGFEAEFIGRLPVRVNCEPLVKEDLANILKYSEGSLLRQYERQFEAYGIEAQFKDDAIDYVAELAVKENTGARSLMTILESLLRDFKYELPGIEISELIVDKSLLENRAEALDKFTQLGAKSARKDALRELGNYLTTFSQTTGVEATFTDEAVDELIQMRLKEGQSMISICQRLFQDYAYGVKLVCSKTGEKSVSLPLNAVKKPDEYLSDLVLSAYEDQS